LAATAFAYSWSVGRIVVPGWVPPRWVRAAGDVTVRVVSTPPGATVILEGKRLGKTPVDVRLPRRERTLLILRLAGHRERRERVVADRDRQLRLDLEPVAPARPPPHP
jgi:hypothetical protein